MLMAMVIAIGPLVWAIVLDNRPRRLEQQEVLTGVELPIAEATVDELVTGRRLETVPAQPSRLETKADTEDRESDGQHDWRGAFRRRSVTVPPY